MPLGAVHCAASSPVFKRAILSCSCRGGVGGLSISHKPRTTSCSYSVAASAQTHQWTCFLSPSVAADAPSCPPVSHFLKWTGRRWTEQNMHRSKYKACNITVCTNLVLPTWFLSTKHCILQKGPFMIYDVHRPFFFFFHRKSQCCCQRSCFQVDGWALFSGQLW